MKFRKPVKSKYRIRDAKLEDSDYLSELQLEYLVRYSTYEAPKAPEKYRMVIGSGLQSNERICVVEDSKDILGFIEQKKINPYQVRLSYPYVLADHEDQEKLQLTLLTHFFRTVNNTGVRVVTVEFSSKISNSTELFRKCGFTNPKSIFQSWEGEINPKDEIDTEPYDVRRIVLDDLDVTYDWIKNQLDRNSPLYISKETYASLLLGPTNSRDGWAIATLDDKPIGMISSIKEENSNIAIIFGPYCDESFINIRIPLLNELFLHYKLLGYSYARILRTNIFDNDKELFNMFGFSKNEEILSMTALI